MVAARVLAFLAAAGLAAGVLGSALRTVVVPRAESGVLTRVVFLGVRRIFDLRVRKADTWDEADRIMARYAPVALLPLPGVWVGDTAALRASILDLPRSFHAELCLRRWWVTATRRGVTSPAGGSTTTGCCCDCARWSYLPLRRGRRIAPQPGTDRPCAAAADADNILRSHRGNSRDMTGS